MNKLHSLLLSIEYSALFVNVYVKIKLMLLAQTETIKIPYHSCICKQPISTDRFYNSKNIK